VTYKSFVVCFLFIWAIPLSGQNKITWLTLEEAEAISQKTPKKLFVKVSTSWCDWCKKLDQLTLAEPQIIRYINENYYPVYIDPERKQLIRWQGKEYKTLQKGPHFINEWVSEYLHGQISFPSIVIIDENFSLIQSIPGYIDAYSMSCILNYFGSDAHKRTPWYRYQKNFDAHQFLFPD
jgi:thioredoxin-related protein